MAVADYAPQDYQPPIAIPSGGQYFDAQTGQAISDLRGYWIKDGDMYYDPTQGTGTSPDEPVTPEVANRAVQEIKNSGGSGRSVQAGGGPAGTASNNFGYQHKPGWLGPATMVASVVNPGIAAVGSVLGKGINVNNMDAVNEARKGLGLTPTTGKDRAKQAMKDNKGQIANVNIGDNKYSVGFEAMSPDNKTNLTYNEAKTRAAVLGKHITETPPEEVTAPPEDSQKSLASRVTGLDKGWLSKALGVEKKAKTEDTTEDKQSPASKLTGLDKGWLSKALTDITGIGKLSPETEVSLPDVVAQTPTARPEDQVQPQVAAESQVTPSTPATANETQAAQASVDQPSQEASIGLSNQDASPSRGLATPSTGFGATPGGTVGTTHQAQSVPGTALGGVGLMSGLTPDKARPNMPGAALTGAIQQAVSQTLGAGYSVSVSSGTEDPGHQHGSPRHKTGLAADVDIVDPSGKKVTDTNQLNDVAAKFAENNPNAGIGFGQGYMTDENGQPGRMHLDTVGKPAQWGATKSKASMATNLSETIDAARMGYQPTPFANAPTPTARPTPTATEIAGTQTPAEQDRNYAGQALGLSPEVDRNSMAQANPSVSPSGFASQDDKTNTGSYTHAPNYGNFTSQDERSSLNDRLGMTPDVEQDPNSFGSMVGDMSSLGTSQNNNTKQPNTPAGLAAMGFTQRTPEEKAAISRTIAGELGQKSLKALASPNPEERAQAMAEVGSMVATMENRAATEKYSGIAKTLDPSQYNANMAANAAVTDQNYASNPAVSNSVGSFYSGGIPGTQYGATNYHATAMNNPPSWSGSMTNPTDIGQHTFGSLPGYSPSASSKAAMQAFGTMAGTQFSPGKAKDDASLGVYGGTPSANANSVGSSPASSGSGSSNTHDSGSSSSGGSGGTGGAGSGSSNSHDGASSPAGGYGSSASKGSTGGL